MRRFAPFAVVALLAGSAVTLLRGQDAPAPAAPQAWEFKVVPLATLLGYVAPAGAVPDPSQAGLDALRGRLTENFSAGLNAQGKDGWQLADTIGGGNAKDLPMLVFQRPKR